MTLAFNKLRPAPGAKSQRKRVGRGIGSGLGKTAGRGHKGQKSRSGGFHKVGFEGGQMPLQRRLPKRGFTSTSNKWANIRLGDLNKIEEGELTRAALKKAGLLQDETCSVKIFLSGKLTKKLMVRDAFVFASAGARSAIRAAGGEIADPQPAAAPTDSAPAQA